MPFHLEPPKNVLLLHWEWTPKIYPIGYPPNKCSKFLLLSLKSFVAEKKHGLCKSYSQRKRRKESIEKMDKCLRDLKQWVLRCPPKKREEMNKIAYVFLQSCFQVSKEIYVFKEHSRIRLATIYIHHIYPHTCTFWFDCMTQLSLDPRFDLQYMHCKYALALSLPMSSA